MLKKRLIACLLYKDGQLVESIGFKSFLIIGNPIMAVKYFNAWEIDEIVFLDINREKKYDFWRDDVWYDNTLTSFTQVIKYCSKSCFVPLTVGGGIRSVDDMRTYIHAGADKISINSGALKNSELISEGARVFGSQCVVVSMDVKRLSDGTRHIMNDFGQTDTGRDAVSWAKEAEQAGAGEIFLTSVDQDGSQKGYDLELVREVASAVKIPVIASGGVGDWKHLAEGLNAGASAVSVGNKFHFTEHSTMHAKKFLKANGVDVR